MISGTIFLVYLDISHLPEPGLRVTGVQRERAATILREAAADGRIPFEELEVRMPGTLEAVVRADLYRVLVDLVPDAELSRLVAAPIPDSREPGMRWEDPLLIHTDWKGYRRCAPWDVPPFIELIGGSLGKFYLNFVGTNPLAPVIDLVISGTAGVTLVVPKEWGADLQQLSIQRGVIGAEITSKVPTRLPAGQTRLVVRGSTTGKVQVRNPTAWDNRIQHSHERREARKSRR